MRHKPERALTHPDMYVNGLTFYVEMRHKPERALTQLVLSILTPSPM